MKKIISMVLALSLVCAMLQGCGSKNEIDDRSLLTDASSSAPVESPAREDASADSAKPKADETPAESTGDSSDPADVRPRQPGHYVFQPKVCSIYMEEVFGKTMCETWYNLVDAVMVGENTFSCPDQHTYDWVMGQFPSRCFPVLTELIDFAWDRSNSVIDGVASFTWLVPPKEAAARITEFAAQVEGILNEALEDDHSDFEKALALYEYFYQTYEYDSDTAEKNDESYLDYLSICRLFKTGMGICSEIAPAYSYLLMQVGVEATTMEGENHEWSYIRINGQDYHVDPTFVLGEPGCNLFYFMMTDKQREITTFPMSNFHITSIYWLDNPHLDYKADDDSFSQIWDYQLEEFFPDKSILRCWQDKIAGAEKSYLDFDYSGY